LALTLDDAIVRAIETSPRLAETRADAAAARATRDSRAALGGPVVTASGGVIRTNHIDEFGVTQPNGTLRVIFPDIPTNYTARGEVRWPIYTGGRVGALVASAAADERAERADGSAAEADLRLEVSRAYWSLVTTRAAADVIAESQARLAAWQGEIRERVDAGVLPPNEVLTVEARLARQSVQLIRARHAADLAGVVLARLIGVPLDTAIDPVTSPETPLAGAAAIGDQPVESLVGRALGSRDERAALTARRESLHAAGDAALAGARPQVAALAAIEPARPNNRFVPRSDEWNTAWDVGVQVTWSVWDGGRARSEQVAALARAEAMTHRLREFDAGLSIAVRARLMAVEAGRAALAASVESVAAAAEAHRVLEERFAAGVATSAEVLDAHVAWLEAELERTEMAAAQRIAEAELLRTIGGR
jgi:outer membrane protein TolC